MKDSRPQSHTLVIDDLLIDELVSGQLTGERYREVLRAFEAQPNKWRDCALAFLEEQALRSELRALAQGTIDWSKDADWSKEATSEKTEFEETTVQPADASQFSAEPALRPSSPRFNSFLSTAALLLVSFTVGWLGSEVIAERQLQMSESEANSIVQKTTLTPPDTNPTTGPSLDDQFVFDGPGALDRGIPISIRKLERDGRINVRTYDMVLPTTFDDGSPGIIPVQAMVLSRGSVESY